MTTEDTKVSINIADIDTATIELRVQTLGERIDAIREERKYLQGVLHQRRVEAHLAQRSAEMHAELDAIHGTAPGALIEVAAKS